ncbi:class D sortase [Neobacillus niacini]|uniref:class D sortase n=1 Tax=Neobacillus niacini TaxID=86668 RepID=UPI0021CB3870|nr:class D sortase [Neobacillus niacini]MCM3763914.1 class D sortase [Neobacillus niacini]
METVRKKKRRKKRKPKILKWILLGVPTLLIIAGIAVISVFGWEMTKETTLLAKTVVKPYKPTQVKKVFETEAWPTMPSPGERLGRLSINSLDLSYPVVQGTHDNELKQGIGHMAGSSLPGQGGHVLLSGHRDTVFRKLKDLKLGDEITFSTPYGDFIYEATETKIVEADDETVAVPTDYETLTLTTCYPFNFIGHAPQRFVIYTKLKSNPLKAEAAS